MALAVDVHSGFIAAIISRVVALSIIVVAVDVRTDFVVF